MHPNTDGEEGFEALLASYETKLAKFTKNIPTKQLIRAPHILMKHNVLRFGTTYCRQKDGVAIGDPPATNWTIQMFAFYQMKVLQDIFGKHLHLDKRFVDDKIGLWKIIPNSKPYNDCKNHLSKFCKIKLGSIIPL